MFKHLEQGAAANGKHVQGVAEGVDLLDVRLGDVSWRDGLTDTAAVDDGSGHLLKGRGEGQLDCGLNVSLRLEW